MPCDFSLLVQATSSLRADITDALKRSEVEELLFRESIDSARVLAYVLLQLKTLSQGK